MSSHKALLEAYPLHSEADALFFNSPDGDSKPSFHFELPLLGYEFSDGPLIGSEIKGLLYYNDDVFGGKLPLNSTTKADFEVDQFEYKGNPYVHIKFFAPGSQDEVLGEFLGADDLHIPDRRSWHQRHEGEWKRVDYLVTTTTAVKVANSTHVTITSDSLGRRAEFDCTYRDPLYDVAFGTRGNLTVKDFKTIGKANSVKWYPDHAVFYEGQGTEDVRAFYFPEKLEVLHGDELVYHNVNWTNT